MAFLKISNSTDLQVTAEIYKSLSYGVEYYHVCLYSITLNITVFVFIQSQTSHFVVWTFVTYKSLIGSWVHGQVSKCKPSEYKSKV